MNTLLVVLALVQADAGTPLEIGRTYHIASRTLGETRVIDVSLPQSYGDDTTRRYPVLVVLDGDYQQQIAAAIAQFYAATSQIPELIVVGVRNTNRSRDMTPPLLPDFPLPPEISEAGGAESFLGFIGDELLPYIDRRYRTVPLRVLVGHSLGGLFATYALSHRPELFIGYVLLEPSLWWNRGHEVDQAKVTLREPRARHTLGMMVNAVSCGLDTTQGGSAAPMITVASSSGGTPTSR